MRVVQFGLLSLIIAAPVVANPVGFYRLAEPNPNHIYGFGGSISGDGLVAGGESGFSSFSPRDTVGIIWSGSMFSTSTSVAPAPSQQPWAYFQGLNLEGSVGTGLTNVSTGPNLNDVRAVPMRWSASTGVVPLVTTSGGQGHDISGDGSVIVGQWSDPAATAPLKAFRWTQSTGMVSLPLLTGATESGNVQVAYAVSNDGNVVVGRSRNGDTTPISVAYAWTQTLGIRQLALLPGATGATTGTARAIAWGANQDGTVIVGEARDNITGLNAALWRFDPATGSSTVINLGDLPGAPITNPTGLPNARARDVSADGKVVIGVGQSAIGNEPFIWFEGQGMFSLQSYLVNNLGLTNLTGWALSDVTGISDDGRTIVGYGAFGGATRAFVAVIPEPATLSLFAAAGVLAMRRRR
jgi:uncharacterized membrane protein